MATTLELDDDTARLLAELGTAHNLSPADLVAALARREADALADLRAEIARRIAEDDRTPAEEVFARLLARQRQRIAS